MRARPAAVLVRLLRLSLRLLLAVMLRRLTTLLLLLLLLRVDSPGHECRLKGVVPGRHAGRNSHARQTEG